ncbi:ATP-binding protein [Siphonobacter sp. SORGH_AS_0500]|uniref:AAA family ATPase n=1 Tax=Siphonobacter sp. SORGH_AS_0500 TaxID=1864824 RepID=UPI002854EB41|nr:ATP-binding protein [Siphonobacter sp. SORGH_AS_0500]MDR6197609.1 SpoVK/Ycf46/Vps4 family AAA+-type ATPase [Siphonobacter sp. SORGH_AS_0500]
MTVSDVIIQDKEKINWQDICLDDTNRNLLNQLIKEYNYVEELRKYNLPVNNKIMLEGSSGCGKTTTAKAIATVLNKPLYVLDLSTVISARIGETSTHLKLVFDKAAKDRAVLFLDEFDHLGKMRGKDDKDVGEMRRLVNTIIQLIDYFPDKALLIAATNHLEVIDIALKRRFQLTLSYQMPGPVELDGYYNKLLQHFPEHLREVPRKYDVSYAEAKDYLFTELKAIIIHELEQKQLAEV